jgi:hypothetical protein
MLVMFFSLGAVLLPVHVAYWNELASKRHFLRSRRPHLVPAGSVFAPPALVLLSVWVSCMAMWLLARGWVAFVCPAGECIDSQELNRLLLGLAARPARALGLL